MVEVVGDLERQGGLSRLARARKHLDESPGPAQSCGEASIERGPAKTYL
jgi:hypothetical protein